MNLQQLQMDLQATNIELSKTYEYLQNYNAFVIAGKATVPLEVARENYLKLAAVKSSIEQAIAATMAQLQNVNNVAVQPTNTGLSNRQPMLNNGNDGYSSNNTNVATSLHSDAKPKQEPTQQNSAPMATKHNVTYRHINYIKEKKVTIDNNKCFGGSTKNTIDIKIIKDRAFNLSPLYLPSEENVCYIAPVKGIIVQDGSNTLSRLVDVPFNVATFASPRSIDSAEFIIYNHIREIMKISVIGAGAMGGSLAQGLLKVETFKPSDITVADPSQDTLQKFAETGASITTDNKVAAESGDIVAVVVSTC